MIENPFNPKPEEVIAWASTEEKWPEQGWDFYVSEDDKYNLVYELACDLKCPQRSFFFHALCVMIGDAIYNEDVDRQEMLLNWLQSLALVEEVPADILEWQNEAVDVLEGKVEFNIDYWYDVGLDRMAGDKALHADKLRG